MRFSPSRGLELFTLPSLRQRFGILIWVPDGYELVPLDNVLVHALCAVHRREQPPACCFRNPMLLLQLVVVERMTCGDALPSRSADDDTV